MQRRICDVLYASENGELPLRELRRRLGEPDRSNVRRAIRGLLEREIVEESGSGGQRRVSLTVWGYIGLSMRPGFPEGGRTSGTGPDQTGRAPQDGSKRRCDDCARAGP